LIHHHLVPIKQFGSNPQTIKIVNHHCVTLRPRCLDKKQLPPQFGG